MSERYIIYLDNPYEISLMKVLEFVDNIRYNNRKEIKERTVVFYCSTIKWNLNEDYVVWAFKNYFEDKNVIKKLRTKQLVKLKKGGKICLSTDRHSILNRHSGIGMLFLPLEETLNEIERLNRYKIIIVTERRVDLDKMARRGSWDDYVYPTNSWVIKYKPKIKNIKVRCLSCGGRLSLVGLHEYKCKKCGWNINGDEL